MNMEVFLIILLLGFSLTANLMFFLHVKDLTAGFEGRIYELEDYIDKKEKVLAENLTEHYEGAVKKAINTADKMEGLFDAINVRQTILESGLENLKVYTYSSMNELLKEKREGENDGQVDL